MEVHARSLGELGIPKDCPAGRWQSEQYLKTRRAQADGDEFKAIRRGLCLGDDAFRKELLENVGARARAKLTVRRRIVRPWKKGHGGRILSRLRSSGHSRNRSAVFTPLQVGIGSYSDDFASLSKLGVEAA